MPTLSLSRLLQHHRSVPGALSPQLDTFRGLSAIAVMVAHASQIFISPFNRGLHVGLGLLAQASVMVFFALSGFLICKSITRIVRDQGRFDAQEYAIDRFNRIFPPFLFAMLLALALWWISPLVFPDGTRSFGDVPPFAARKAFELDAASFFGTLLFLNGFGLATISVNGPLWSLSFEIWYYVAAGLAASFRGRGWVAAAVLMLALGAVNRVFLMLSLVWFAGAGLALLHNHGLNFSRAAKLTGAITLSVAAAFAALHVTDYLSVTAPNQLNGRWILGFNVAIGVSFACLLHRMASGSTVVPPALPSTAKFSYTLYIVHFPLLLFIYGASRPWITGLAPALACAVAGAALALLLARTVALRAETMRPLRHRQPLAAAPVEPG